MIKNLKMGEDNDGRPNTTPEKIKLAFGFHRRR